MNWDELSGKWKQIRGAARQRWAKLTDDDLEYVAGTRDRLIGRIQERYGITRQEAERQAEEWFKSQKAA
jgi:uncharacterized protein YjbJ (UPF0337 family)